MMARMSIHFLSLPVITCSQTVTPLLVKLYSHSQPPCTVLLVLCLLVPHLCGRPHSPKPYMGILLPPALAHPLQPTSGWIRFALTSSPLSLSPRIQVLLTSCEGCYHTQKNISKAHEHVSFLLKILQRSPMAFKIKILVGSTKPHTVVTICQQYPLLPYAHSHLGTTQANAPHSAQPLDHLFLLVLLSRGIRCAWVN